MWSLLITATALLGEVGGGGGEEDGAQLRCRQYKADVFLLLPSNLLHCNLHARSVREQGGGGEEKERCRE